MAEVITIQCGHYSNFVGTHYWNTQEPSFEYDSAPAGEEKEIISDVTFREGLTLQGEVTYTPRLIALDLPGSLNTLRESGHLYQPAVTAPIQWQGGVEKHSQTAAVKNDFLTHLEEVDSGRLAAEEFDGRQYSLDGVVRVWSDFLRLHLHPNSLLMVPGHTHPGSESGFDVYPAGLSVWESKKFRDSFEDKLHYFTEECDHLQGFQLLVDWDNGFGGVASCLAQEIADEYSSKGLLSFLTSPLTEPIDKMPNFRPMLFNQCLSLSALCENSSLVCPLSQLANPWRTLPENLRTLPSLSYDPSLAYHSSALFASALDTVSLLYRTEHSPATLSSLPAGLTLAGRKVCSMSVSLPLVLTADTPLLSELDQTPLHTRLHPLSPISVSDPLQRWSQAVTVRGIPPAQPLCSREDPRFFDVHRHPSHALAQHLSEHFPSSLTQTQLCTVRKPLVIKPPYPSMLPLYYSKSKQAPVGACLHTDSSIQDLLATITTEFKSSNVKRFPAYSSTCLDEDSCSELIHSLAKLREAYRTGAVSDSGSTDSD